VQVVDQQQDGGAAPAGAEADVVEPALWRRWTGAGQRIVYPPSTTRSAPLIMSAALDAR
jgi:hypothetical protein